MKKIAIVLFTALVLTACNGGTENGEVVNGDSTVVVAIDTNVVATADTAVVVSSTSAVEVTVAATSTVK